MTEGNGNELLRVEGLVKHFPIKAGVVAGAAAAEEGR